jgi:glycosyltransferase involved in cell wall biosynthesis
MSRRQGVNVIGYLRAEFGLAEIARKLAAASERAGVPTSTVNYRRTVHRQEHPFDERGRADAPYDTNVICVNADQLPFVHRDLGPRLLAGRYSVGVWFWELSHFPANLHSSFELVEEVWVASEFTRDSIAQTTDKPVRVVPIPLEPPPSPTLGRAELGLSDSYLFLFAFDYYSLNARKNPIGVVEAFKRAFAPGEGPQLVIKSVNGEKRREALQRLHDAADGRSDIEIRNGYVSVSEKDALMGSCDCYVSLHRSEGLGLTMAEAMSFGKPVIATGYSGNLTFMDGDNSYLVRHAMTAAPPGSDPYLPGVEWAEPDLDHAAELMRRVYERPEEAALVGERARRSLLERHSLDPTGAFIRERLERVPERTRRLLEAREPLDHAAAIAGSAPGEGLDQHFSHSPLRILRRFLRRVLWPEFAEQRRLDASVVESLQGLVAELDRDLREAPDRRQGEDERRSDAALAGDSLEYLLRRQWRDKSVAYGGGGIPASLTRGERRLLYALARDYAREDAALVDVGCFLGGSTAALLTGLRDRPEPWTGPPLASYDLFSARQQLMPSFLPEGAAPRVGESFRQQYDRNVAGFGVPHVVHPGDIADISWSGGPIDVLFLDRLQTWDANEAVVQTLFPALRPGRSAVVVRDYGAAWAPWIPITVELMGASLRLIDGMERGSHVFFLQGEVPSELMTEGVSRLDDATKLGLLEQSIARCEGWVRGLQEIARAELIHERFGAEAAVQELQRIAEAYADYSIVVASSAQIQRGLEGQALRRGTRQGWKARLSNARKALTATRASSTP